jgi:serine/threonine-protein kinase RsbW
MSLEIEARVTVRADGQAMAPIRDFLVAFAGAHAIDGDDRSRVLIVVEELITNLVKFGYPGQTPPGSAEITLRLDDDRLSIEIVDDGREFDPFAAPEPDLDATLEARRVGGLGLHLVKSLMDRTAYRRERDRNIVEMSRRVALCPER